MSSGLASGVALNDGALTLSNSRLQDNTGSSAIYAAGTSTLTVVNSRIFNNSSKGLIVSLLASATLINSTIDGNSTPFDGVGITNAGTLTVVNSTISGNSTPLSGGGIWNNNGTTTLFNSTITANIADSDGNNSGNGGGVYNGPTGTLTVYNSIIAGNMDGSSGTQEPDCSGTLDSQGYNLIESLAGCTVTGDTTGNITGANPDLGPLQNNGGSTPTHALLSGSPAIDAGNPAGCMGMDGMPLRFDQRGYIRPVDGGSGSGICDMGAFEYDSPGPHLSTLTVDHSGDASDLNPGDRICDSLMDAGEQCTLRAAIEEFNALGPAATPYLIEFNIPGSGPHTLMPASPLPAITVPVTINGVSQPGSACPSVNEPATLLIVLDGSNAGGASGLVLDEGSEGSMIGGLVIGNFEREGIVLLSDDNEVGCSHIGVGSDGFSPMGNGQSGIRINGDRNTIGQAGAPAWRNVLSANGGQGVRIAAGMFSNIHGNFVGVTADGMDTLGNAGGIAILGDSAIVGSIPLRAGQMAGAGFPGGGTGGNLISGNSGFGIRVEGANDSFILGNAIGLARDGVTPLGNGGNGIEVVGDASRNYIGGTRAADANYIAHNSGGVFLISDSDVPTGNPIRGNAIFSNSDQGIGLGTDGVDINDVGDLDEGENQRQNYPVLIAAAGSLTVTGTLDSQPNQSYEIDLYRSESCHATGYGEGERYITTLEVTTDGSGHAEFDVFVGPASPGDSITATATDEQGNTSEFSACVMLSGPPTTTATTTPTATFGPPPTATQTQTPGPSPTATLTATFGPSPTATQTQTPGPSPTATPTATFGPSPTATQTQTPGPSPTATQTHTPGPSPTATEETPGNRLHLPLIQQ